MGICFGAYSVNPGNLALVRADPALVWRVLEPEDDSAYLKQLAKNNKTSLLRRLFGIASCCAHRSRWTFSREKARLAPLKSATVRQALWRAGPSLASLRRWQVSKRKPCLISCGQQTLKVSTLTTSGEGKTRTQSHTCWRTSVTSALLPVTAPRMVKQPFLYSRNARPNPLAQGDPLRLVCFMYPLLWWPSRYRNRRHPRLPRQEAR